MRDLDSTADRHDAPSRPDGNRLYGLISPTGPGSLGDQAMLEAASSWLLDNRGGRAFVIPDSPPLRSATEIWAAGGLPGQALISLKAVTRADTLLYIGADVLDGVYGAGSSLKRLRLLSLNRRLGGQVRVLGCSWSETPAPEVAEFLRKAPWLDVLARDPISQGRMSRAIGREVRLVADLAFLMKPEARAEGARKAIDWIRGKKAGGATVLGVNLSGHTIRKLPDRSTAPVAETLSRWLEDDPDRVIVLLPHDVRPGYAGDLKVLAELRDRLSERHADRIYDPEGNLDAWDLKAMAGEVDLVMTGRMHLAIASLGMGTPPLCTVYQGKFEGLMQHFSLSGLTVSPEDLLTPALGERLGAVTREAADYSARIKAALPGVQKLSRSNFDGIA